MYFQDRYLSEEQRMMRDTTRQYVDHVVIPFIQQNRLREWDMDPSARLAPNILEQADAAGLRALGVPPRFGGIALDPATQSQTLAIIATETSPRRLGSGRQAGAELEDLGADRPVRPRAPPGVLVHPLHERAAVPDGALPDRAPRGVGPLAALQRPRDQHGHQGRPRRRPLGDQRPQAVHQQRLRRHALRRLRQHRRLRRHAAGHVELPRAARHARDSR